MPRNAMEEQQAPAAKLVAVDGRTYPLESAEIIARAEGGLAQSSLVQKFANPYDEALELIYTMPLPADGAVLGYTIQIGDKRIVADVQPREQAARAYRQAIHEGRTAGLLEQARPDTFVQKLGNVPARTKVEVTIDVLHPLAFVFAGVQAVPHWEYRFPTVVGVRYSFAEPRIIDASGLAPDRGDTSALITLTLAIRDAESGQPHSPSHAIRSALSQGANLVTAGEPARLDRDIVVRWPAAAAHVGVRVAEAGGLPGDDGRYALVTIVPPAQVSAPQPRDLIVLLDTSGSMSGEPLALAKRVVHELLGSLEAGDRFELIEFSNSPRRMTAAPVPVSERAVRDARHWLAALNAGGSTEMETAMQEALRPLRNEAQRQIVLVTDGQIDFEAKVVARAAMANNVRLHVVGVGQCPNRSLTQQAAAAGRGLEFLAGDASGASDVAARLIAGTARPVLTNVRVEGSALTGEPRTALRDVFAGQPLLVSAELSRTGGVLEVRGDLAGSREPWVQRVSIPAQYSIDAGYAHSALPLGAYHGRCVAGELELRRGMPGYGHDAGVDARVEALGMRHRIATSRTSLVAMEETPSVDPREPSRRVKLAVEMPAGVDAWGVGLQRDEALMMSVMAKMAPRGAAASMPPMMMDSALAEAPEESALEAPMRMARAPEPGFKGSGGGRRRTIRIESVHVRWLSSDVLEVQFETPHDGFRMPSSPVGLLLRGMLWSKREVGMRILEDSSTKAGPHGQGLLVRLVIQLFETLTPGQRFEILWEEQHSYVIEGETPEPLTTGGA
jgi:Ca-activated chloride channel family protein